MIMSKYSINLHLQSDSPNSCDHSMIKYPPIVVILLVYDGVAIIIHYSKAYFLSECYY